MTSVIIALICINAAALCIIFFMAHYIGSERKVKKENEKITKETLKTYEKTDSEIKKNMDEIVNDVRNSNNIDAVNDVLQNAHNQGRQRLNKQS